MSHPADVDDLQSFFTDVEHLRGAFAALVAAPTLSKRILVIHGVGGIGKTSLLRMFRLHCKNVHVPVALASGDESKSAPAILSDWANDLKTDGVQLKKLSQTLQHFRLIQAKAEDKARESQQKAGDLAGKAAGKVAETAAGAAIGAIIGSAIPGLGTLVGALGGMGAEALVDWLRGQGFSGPDIDLLLDATKRLTDDFLLDIEAAASKRRIVVMLDTFEQLSALEDWARDLAQRLPVNVLFVISGRAMPKWSRAWPTWLAQAQAEELKPMSEDVMRTLIVRYYALLRGDQPDPAQVESIIRFARGLPVVVNTAVRLWVEYGVEDFEAVKPEVVADLVDRLREGVPQELIPTLEAAATLRYFNKELLRVVTGLEDVNNAYGELRRFPFVRPRVEGLALHDAVREIMDDHLHVHDPGRHSTLHERAAIHFETQMAKRTGQEAERLGFERLYHHIRLDEETGIKLFQEMADELTWYRLVNRLRALLNDANTYPLEHENIRLWRDYYRACLLDQEGQWLLAEDLFRKIAQTPNASNQVRSYALVRWGEYLARPERISKPGGAERAIQVFQSSVDLLGSYDSHTVYSAWELGIIYERLCQWEKAWQYFDDVKRYAASLGKGYQAAHFKEKLKDPYVKTGNWRELLNVQEELHALLDDLPIPSDTKANLLATWMLGFNWLGRYKEVEQTIRNALKFSLEVDIDESGYRRDLGLSLGLQDRFDEAHQEFQTGMDDSKEWAARRANFDLDRAILLHYSFWGTVHLRAGELRQARRKFFYAVWLKRKHKDYIGFPELYVGLGIVYELSSDYFTAQKWYLRCVELRWTGRLNFICGALTGLARVKHALGDFVSIPPLLVDAEQLAQQYEYNDHLASLRLTQGHIVWDGRLAEWGQGFDAAFDFYKQALTYALRFNRFLLDEALSGRPQGTPLRPIIPVCQRRGEEGRRMLIALRDWWKTGHNDLGVPRPDTISPVPEGIPLLEGERLARQREPGDGLPQKTVIEQIEAALQS
jgi:tetratricopeptide (TPR) repeat protein